MSRLLADFVRAVAGLEIEARPGPAPGRVVGGRAWFAVDDERGLGPAIRWTRAHAPDGGVTPLHVLAPGSAAPTVARRAALLTAPIEVWVAEDGFRPAEPEPPPLPPRLPDAHWALAAVLAEAGARPVDDHGVLVGEVAGLEVARVVDGGGAAGGGGGPGGGGTGARLEVGVGLADRELQHYVHGHLDDHDNLRRAVAAVARHRRPGSGAHPLARVARQRWLRSVVLDRPQLLDLEALEPVVPLRPKGSVLATDPAPAAGDGAVVVCSVGVDLDLLPEAADYRHLVDPSAHLVVVVPERDRRLVELGGADLVPRLTVTSIGEPWATPAPRSNR